MIAIRSGVVGFAVLKPDRPTGFANVTTGLGIAISLDEWHWREWRAAPGTCVCLATDGIADDPVPGKEEAFFAFAAERYRWMPAAAGRRHLTADLREWPVSLHGDNKTAVLF